MCDCSWVEQLEYRQTLSDEERDALNDAEIQVYSAESLKANITVYIKQKGEYLNLLIHIQYVYRAFIQTHMCV